MPAPLSVRALKPGVGFPGLSQARYSANVLNDLSDASSRSLPLSDHLFITLWPGPFPPLNPRLGYWHHVLQDTVSEPCAWGHALPPSVPIVP